eukprot:CAMPEP_0116930250 /NCGR_PEP_ID=MMETSP0467-20121206/27084_1 /TAXON_ID=283647 /ORGANISM="Mesodinium pulex, Strain SPMC105" /LENGTH=110 /DNA_ID=CAMNT_0004610413 /DNA_START=976 /DNA_END=1308 /DNA_ORIENTATION=+
MENKHANEFDNCFKWVDEFNKEHTLKVRRARDEPNDLIWENIICEKDEIKTAKRRVNMVMFAIVIVCLVLIYIVMRWQNDVISDDKSEGLDYYIPFIISAITQVLSYIIK